MSADSLRPQVVEEETVAMIAALTGSLDRDQSPEVDPVHTLLEVRSYLSRANNGDIEDVDFEPVVLTLIGVINTQARAMLREREFARVKIERYRERLAKMQELVDALKIEATIDRMTGLWNKKTFDEYAPAIFDHFVVEKQVDLSYLFIDIDYFKPYNDEYSYEVGDFVIQQLSKILREELRVSDLVFRGPATYTNPIPAREGGEEFSILLPFTSLEDACRVAERIRQRVEREMMEYKDPNTGQTLNLFMTVSTGVVTANSSDQGFGEMKARVVNAIHNAKEVQGRNSTVKQERTETGENKFTCVSPPARRKPVPRKRYVIDRSLS